MKKIDILLSLITGEGVAILFLWLLKNSPFYFSFFPFLLPLVFPLLATLAIFFAEMIGKKYLFVYQLVKFLLVGALFAVFDLIILNLLIAWLGISREETIKYAFFVALSFTLITIFKYFLNKYWAFEKKEKERIEKEFSLFFLVTIFSGTIQTTVAAISFRFLIQSLSPFLAGNLGKILGIIIASLWNFVGYKFFVFKK